MSAEVAGAERIEQVLGPGPVPSRSPRLQRIVSGGLASARAIIAARADYELRAKNLRQVARIALIREQLKRPGPLPRRKTGRERGIPPPAMADDET